MDLIPIEYKNGVKSVIEVCSVQEFINGADLFLQDVKFKFLKQSPKAPKTYYINAPITFDIETTKIEVNGENFTFMYHWQMTINGVAVFGRTWDEWVTIIAFIHSYFEINPTKRARIFVHNLGYEFAFFQSRLPVGEVFAREPNHPLKVSLKDDFEGIEFLCTLSISGYSLERLAKNISQIPLLKLKGDLDYNVIRTAKTKLKLKEKQYCLNDVLVLHYYVQYLIDTEKQKNVGAIPLTKTGFIRRDCRNEMLKDIKYREMLEKSQLSPKDFILYNRAFMGGDTHASHIYYGEIVENTNSYDISSSYPYRFLAEYFPIGTPLTVNNPSQKSIEHCDKKGYLYIAEITILNIRPKSYYSKLYIQSAKCKTYTKRGYQVDNGRIIRAQKLTLTLTSIDWEIVRDNYDFEIESVNNLIYHNRKGLLPKAFRDYIIKAYAEKTQLKGVDGKEVEYQRGKEKINSLYGMCVTNPIHDEVIYNGVEFDYTIKKQRISTDNITEIEKGLTEHYSKKTTFLPYQWGVFCTAYARRDLHRGVNKAGRRAMYWDTDSVKIDGDAIKGFKELNRDKIKHLFNIGYTVDEIAPRDINGHRHPIGLWEKENTKPYKFRTLGAKKYFTEIDGKPSLTVSGLNKKTATDYIVKTKGSIFNVEIGDIIPKEFSGRLCAEYVNEHTQIIIDEVLCEEFTFVNLTPTTYQFNDIITDIYNTFDIYTHEYITNNEYSV